LTQAEFFSDGDTRAPIIFRGYRVAEIVVKNFWRHVSMAEEISLVMSVGCFALVVGFLSGYAVRAYLSYLHHSTDHI
jgi:hypothetical protein